MSRTAKSQWDFGELFPVEQTRRVLSVSELTATVRRLLEKEVGEVWVTGEVTNLRAQGSGHVYFTLKDAAAQLSCVLFRNEPVANRPDEFGRIIKADADKWGAIGRKLGVKLD